MNSSVITLISNVNDRGDLGKHKVFDILPGKSQADLHHSLVALSGRDQVKIVCMDLSESYRRLVKTYFPQAQIVADRFLVIRLVNHAFLRTFQELDSEIKLNRMNLGLLRPHAWNVSKKKEPIINAYLANNLLIQILYEAKQAIKQLLLCQISKKKQLLEKKFKSLLFPLF